MDCLCKSEVIEKHQKLWDWLYHHPYREKYDWPEWEVNGGEEIDETDGFCFCCHFAVTISKLINPCGDSCVFCPLDWGTESGRCDGHSAYSKWIVAKTSKTRKKYAAIIRDLPENKYEKLF